MYTVQVFNFEGFKFLWTLWLLAIHQNIKLMLSTHATLRAYSLYS